MDRQPATKLSRLIGLLRELFQLDQPDLDFGLYRIMHAKSGEVTQFLEKDLFPQVKKAFEQYQPADKAAIKKKLDQAVAAAESLGVDPDTNDKVLQLRSELAEGADLEAMESDVYDQLYSFFRRYYSEGDFLAKRVYKPGVYAVPYEGEEVVLHWANKDQYYIKTSEYLRDYAFRLKPVSGDTGGDPMRVHFRLVAAAEGEHGNNKAAEGKDRVFILAPAGESGHDFLSVETVDGREELVIGFEYRPARMDDWTEEFKAQATAAAKKKPPKQKDLIDIAVKAVLATTGDAVNGWIGELAKPHTKVNGETAEYCRLEGHLNRYCARHTFDYFIHKELGGFLRRELDFYIKNEVMHLDDVQNEDAPKVEQYLSKIKVIRTIAGKVIDFLEQVEEFQKTLWLKKKFITECFYCVRIDLVPDDFYPEICENRAQYEEWVTLYALEDVATGSTGSTTPQIPTPDTLKAHPTLLIDTRHFDRSFAERLLDAIGDVDELTDGVLMHSENFQALRLLHAGYRNRVECIYIDPPYNTGDSQIPYKNAYLRSSWLSLMGSRLELAKPLMTDDSVLYIAIDDFEMANVSKLVDTMMPDMAREMIIVNHHPQGGKATTMAHTHEYMLTVLPMTSSRTLVGRPRGEDGSEIERRPFKRSGTAESNFRYGRPNSFYALLVDPETFDVVGAEPPPVGDDYPREPDSEGRLRVYPLGENGQERVWRRSFESGMKLVEAGKLDCTQNLTVYQLLAADERRTALFSNWVDPRYNAGTFGANLLRDVIGEQNLFAYPKSIFTVADAITAMELEDGSTVLDFFGGSGTTAHAVMHVNREDGERRRFFMVETMHYFDQVLLPRVKKVAYAPEWKGGKPSRLCTPEEADRSPRIIKVVRLESYDDSLNNLAVTRDEPTQALLATPEAHDLAEDYVLRYMLNVETRGSNSLLSVKAFVDPDSYHLSVKAPGSDENRDVAVNLIETFNWLLGLCVLRIGVTGSFSADFERNSEGRLAIKGRIKEAPDGRWWFRTVTGTTPDGKRALIIWRKRPGGDEPEGIEQDNAVLDAWFRTQGYSTTDSEFDIVWVNGDNNLANLRQDDTPDDGLGETGWKVRIIEQDFHRLMFDTSDVPGGA